MSRMWWMTAVLCAVAAATSASGAIAAPDTQGGCAGNRLANPGFEGGSHKTEGEGTSLSSAVGDGWHPWFVRGGEETNREPEFKVEQVALGGDPFRVRSGANSMKQFTTWATHTAGVYQRVAVPPGSTVTFSAYSMSYTGEADGWNGDLKTFLSDPERPGEYGTWVGIEPTGAVPAGAGSPPPASVVWSPQGMTYDQWVYQSVSTVARAGAITVYVKGAPRWSVKHNDSFWDDTCLVAVAPPAPTPKPKRYHHGVKNTGVKLTHHGALIPQ